MEDEILEFNKNESEFLNGHELSIKICDKGFNCDEIDFYHFIHFIHAPSNDSCNVIKKVDNKYSVIFNKNDLPKNYILRNSFNELNDMEKRRIIENFHKVSMQFNKLKDLYIDKCLSYDGLLLEFEEIALVQGEKQALDAESLTFLSIYPSHKLTERNIGNDHHFRLAESQFYRLIYGSDNKISNLPKSVSYKVSFIDYVVNSKLLDKFTKFKTFLRTNRGEEYCKTILGFHGTDEANIENICQQGFLDPTHSDFQQSTDSGYYGRGIYFSQYPTYAMQYIRGCKTLLLCQILLGRVFSCDVVKHGQNCESAYDSHCSPNANELVVFSSDQILPRYIVHFETVTTDINVTDCQPSLIKYNSKFDVEFRECSINKNNHAEKRKAVEMDLNDILENSKRLKPSRLLEDAHIYVHSPAWSNNVTTKIETLLTSHGAIIDDINFSIFVTDEDNVKRMGESYRISSEKNCLCFLISSLMQMLNDGKYIKESASEYLIKNNDF